MKRKWIPIILFALAFLLIVIGRLSPLHKKGYTQELTTLLYHHFVEEYDGSNAVSRDTFDKHLTELREAGYNFVCLDDIVGFVKYGLPLPEKALLITMDDGYLSNITVAAPILEKHGACAVVAAIGCSIGKDTYKDTSEPITPHFSLEEALPFVKKGTLEIISHSWDMHKVQRLDGEDCRVGMLPLENETPEEYKAALQEDLEKSKNALEGFFKKPVSALAYPYGWYSDELEKFLENNGILITFTTNPGTSTLCVKELESLRLLNRIAMDEQSDINAIVDSIKGEEN